MSGTAAYYVGDRTFSIEAVEAPSTGGDQVTIDVAYTGICGTDLHAYLGHMDQRIGLHRVIGHEMSGVVAAIGANVDNAKVGDRVVVRPLDHCGTCPACQAGHAHICHHLKFLGLDTDGAFQSQWTVPAHTIHHLPDSLSLKEAALIEPLAVACHDVSRAELKDGEDVLVIGGGPIGMLIAMVARQRGGKVIVSEVNDFRLDMARKLGMTAINPTETDVVAAVDEATRGNGADVVLEVSGTQAGADLMTEVVATRGRIVMVAIHAERRQVDLFRFFWREIEMLGARVYEPADYDAAISLLADGAVDAPAIITDVRPLGDIGDAFADLTGNPRSMKTLLKIVDVDG